MGIVYYELCSKGVLPFTSQKSIWWEKLAKIDFKQQNMDTWTENDPSKFVELIEK